MLKGVNRQVIEVNETGSPYYERALLVVRPEYAEAERVLLEREAKKVLRELDRPSCIKKGAKLFYWLPRLTASAAVGAGVTALFMLL